MNMKGFPPIDDLYDLLSTLEDFFGTHIKDEDFIIGRQQLFSMFFHELMHAFITNKAGWIHTLEDDEVDVIDELVVRVLLDFTIERFNFQSKMNPYFEHYVRHDRAMKNYGYNFEPSDYNQLKQVWNDRFSKTLDINGYCKYI